MSDRASRYAEVFIELRAARLGTAGPSDDGTGSRSLLSLEGSIQSYDALIYADPGEFGHLAGPLKGYAYSEMGDLPLIAVGDVSVCWDDYFKYLKESLLAEEEPSRMLARSLLFRSVSANLTALLQGGQEPGGHRLRLWWSSAIPNLVELPWELLAYDGESRFNEQLSFVRGVPPEAPVPRIPVGEKLRLAFIHLPQSAPAWLAEALAGLDGVEVVEIVDHPLRGLQRAAREGFELVHLVAAGSVSLAHDGFLYLNQVSAVAGAAAGSDGGTRLGWLTGLVEKITQQFDYGTNSTVTDMFYRTPNEEVLSPAALSSLLWGSRVTVLSLSAPKGIGNSRLDAMFSHSSYRAFAAFGNSPLPMPNIVAQTCMVRPDQLKGFWHGFYGALAATVDIEQAMLSARTGVGEGPPLALFLRQRRGAFTRTDRQAHFEPALLSAELQRTNETLRRLRDLKQLHPSLSEALGAVERNEIARQKSLEEQLRPWIQEQE